MALRAPSELTNLYWEQELEPPAPRTQFLIERFFLQVEESFKTADVALCRGGRIDWEISLGNWSCSENWSFSENWSCSENWFCSAICNSMSTCSHYTWAPASLACGLRTTPPGGMVRSLKAKLFRSGWEVQFWCCRWICQTLRREAPTWAARWGTRSSWGKSRGSGMPENARSGVRWTMVKIRRKVL